MMRPRPSVLLCSLFLTGHACLAATGWIDVTQHGVPTGADTEATAAVQGLLDAGPVSLFFPPGTYRLRTLRVGSKQALHFARGAVWQVVPSEVSAQAARISGSDIEIRGVRFALEDLEPPPEGSAEHVLFAAVDCDGLRVTGVVAEREHQGEMPLGEHRGWRADVTVVKAENCRDLEVDHCRVQNLRTLVDTRFCRNVSVHENRGEWCEHLSRFAHGSRDVRHYANWSRYVCFQAMWWGGDANDTHAWVPDHTANVVRPDLGPTDTGYLEDTAGVYNVNVQNNTAEYGITLCWGAKARTVSVTGNTARFMADMAYDSEGDENVLIADNISINSSCAGIGCYFWTDKVLISGNQLFTLDQGEARYQGNFIRLHCAGAGPEHFGTGNCLVTGNLMVSEVGAPRAVAVEACRDVTFSGNKFVNGVIDANPWVTIRRITVQDNEFHFRNGEPATAIKLVSRGADALVQGNTLLWEHPETTAPQDVPAILLRGTGARTLLALHNTVRGWPTALACEVVEPSGPGPRFVVRDNTVDGRFLLPDGDTPCRVLEQGTLDLGSTGAGVTE